MTRLDRGFLPGLALIVAGGWLMRMLPLLLFGADQLSVIYDEGTYFTAAALLARGLVPYRDFVYPHPPAFLGFLALLTGPFSVSDPAAGLAASRWIAAAVGAINIGLIGWLTRAGFGPVAGVVAALVYAVHPATVAAERGAMIEPALNLFCLGLALAWLQAKADFSTRRAGLAGVMLGLAVMMKMWGALWLLPCLLSMPDGFDRKRLAAFATGAIAAVAICLGPFLAIAPDALMTQTVWMQIARPPDGLAGADRFAAIFSLAPERALATMGLVAGTLIVFARGRNAARAERFFAAAAVSIVAAFLLASSFFDHYLAHLCVPAGVLTGLVASDLVTRSASLSPRVRAVVGAAIVVVFGSSAVRVMLQPVRAPWIPDIGLAVRTIAPVDASLVAFEPAWSLAGGRLPAATSSSRAFVDPYGAMLAAALTPGKRFPDTASALHSADAQRLARTALANAQFVILGPRGHVQLTPETLDWFSQCFVRRYPAPGVEALDLWEKRLGSPGCSP